MHLKMKWTMKGIFYKKGILALLCGFLMTAALAQSKAEACGGGREAPAEGYAHFTVPRGPMC